MLRTVLPDQGKSKEGRQRMVDKAITKIKQNVSMSDKVRDSIYEQFDPLLITTEIVEKNAPSILDAIIDYEGDDAGFIKVVKERSGDLIVKIITDIQEGFIEEFNDVLVFFKETISGLLDQAAEPPQAKMAKAIAMQPFIKFVERVWSDHQKKTEGADAAPALPKPQEKPKEAPAPVKTEEKKQEAAPATTAPVVSDALVTQSLSSYLASAKS